MRLNPSNLSYLIPISPIVFGLIFFFVHPLVAIWVGIYSIAIGLVVLILLAVLKYLPKTLKRRRLWAIAITCIIVLGPALIISLVNQIRISELIKADQNNLSLPLNFNTVAIRRWDKFETNVTSCDDLCLHLLISGASERVVIIKEFDITSPPSFQSIGTAFHLETRKTCPDLKFESRSQTLRIKPFEGRKRYYHKKMEHEISKGRCLIQSSTDLSRVDMVISTGSLRNNQNGTNVKLPLFSQAAGRVSVHVRNENRLEERYSWTGLTYNNPFNYVPLPRRITGQYQISIGYDSFISSLGPSSSQFRYMSDEYWTHLLTTKMGVKFK